jgi:hypothetical protein
VGTPANLQRKEFDNWSAKKRSVQGEFGTSSAIVYWGDFKERDEKMRQMRVGYEVNEDRRALIREAFAKLDADADGVVTLQDIKRNYDASKHPMARTRRWTEEQVRVLVSVCVSCACLCLCMYVCVLLVCVCVHA